ncbi:ABC transporter ATP-binding protein [Gordonia hankookensis]|uniref:ABC transporter ATP-binding protein n=1 Tax=Gordonia hankookensis TaxID=589403 RepID=A0ABR7WF92_9ACTN|nr:ABC transporter ATP-binding protein [Gordonia hankookensis]MBD1321058.1 ABC transporter ATP-binding protein [Gordonia hankookensis]NDZ96631.1 ABC transporter ATP-binding protein [Streptomyces sp. SID11726]NEB23351.1 ABC transporter ATP-binding protein [Streptomyces sp. SID6673]
MREVDYDQVGVEIGHTTILRDVTVHAPRGSFLGIIGPNGSGKSTMLRCLYRALDPTEGRVQVGDRDITSISMRDNARQVAALTQRIALDFDFTAAEVVATGRLPHRSLTTSTARRDREICVQAMSDAGVTHLVDRAFTSLSGGEAQRVLIARAFAQEPEVLVLDEPTNHLDVRHQYAVLRAARDREVTVVAALHDLNIAAQFCDRLVVLAHGRVAATGTPREVLTPAAIHRFFGIGSHVFDHPRLNVPQVIFDEKEVE